MHIERVSAENFLSYRFLDVPFEEGLTVIYGMNAAGKTNLVDAVYLCSLGRSSRLSKDKDLVKWGSENGCSVSVIVKTRFSRHTVDIVVGSDGKKKVFIDRLPVRRLGELMGAIGTAFFSPEETKLVRGAPEDRRRFLDIALSQQNKSYFYTLKRYNSLLMQRNKILKEYRGKEALGHYLNIVDSDMSRMGAFVAKCRRAFVKELEGLAAARHSALTSGSEKLTLKYESDCGESEEEFSKKLLGSRKNDIRLEFTGVGVHRDDLRIAADGVDLRKFGSQGQQRTAALALKLAETDVFERRTGEKPVLILDDVLSELDPRRREGLFEAVKGVQTLVTCTDPPCVPGAHYYRVRDGEVIPEDAPSGEESAP